MRKQLINMRLEVSQELQDGAHVRGWMIKKKKDRWFVLTDDMLFYFKNKEDIFPCGVIFLFGCTVPHITEESAVTSLSFPLGTMFSLQLRGDMRFKLHRFREVELVCGDREEMQYWIDNLHEHIQVVTQTHSTPMRMEGYLMVLCGKRWKRTYCVFLGHYLLFLKAADAKVVESGMNMYQIKVVQTFEYDEEHRRTTFRILDTQAKEAIYSAPNVETREKWVMILETFKLAT